TREVETEHPWGGRIPAGEPVHDMWLRLTLDDKLKVHDVEAAVDRSPYPPCPHAVASLAVLKGHSIAPGWSLLVKKLLGGAKSCTHLMELLMPIATTAYQTMAPHRRAAAAPVPGQRPGKIDSCYAYS